MTEEYEGQFRNWTTSLQPEDWGEEVLRLKVYRISLVSPAQALSRPRKIVLRRTLPTLTVSASPLALWSR